MLEAVFEELLIEYAEARGWIFRKLKFIGRRGAPDRMFAKDGRVMFVELKAPGKPPSTGQVREIRQLRAAGLDVHLIDNLNSGYALFEH